MTARVSVSLREAVSSLQRERLSQHPHPFAVSPRSSRGQGGLSGDSVSGEEQSQRMWLPARSFEERLASSFPFGLRRRTGSLPRPARSRAGGNPAPELPRTLWVLEVPAGAVWVASVVSGGTHRGWATCELGGLGKVGQLSEPLFSCLLVGTTLTSRGAC